MAYDLIISPSFENDLDETLNYISNKLYSPLSAQNLLNKAEKIISNINDDPFLYPKCRNERLAQKGYHYAIVNNYLLFYSIDENIKQINILRFLYGRRNIGEILA